MRYEKFNECFSFALHYNRNWKNGSEMRVPPWTGSLRGRCGERLFPLDRIMDGRVIWMTRLHSLTRFGSVWCQQRGYHISHLKHTALAVTWDAPHSGQSFYLWGAANQEESWLKDTIRLKVHFVITLWSSEPELSSQGWHFTICYVKICLEMCCYSFLFNPTNISSTAAFFPALIL